MKLTHLFVILAIVATQLSAQVQDPAPSFTQRPFPGFAPDQETAIGVAKVVIPRLLGYRYALARYEASLKKGIWTVTANSSPNPHKVVDRSLQSANADPESGYIGVLRMDAKTLTVKSFSIR